MATKPGIPSVTWDRSKAKHGTGRQPILLDSSAAELVALRLPARGRLPSRAPAMMVAMKIALLAAAGAEMAPGPSVALQNFVEASADDATQPGRGLTPLQLRTLALLQALARGAGCLTVSAPTPACRTRRRLLFLGRACADQASTLLFPACRHWPLQLLQHHTLIRPACEDSLDNVGCHRLPGLCPALEP